jgi:hypothetical protein
MAGRNGIQEYFDVIRPTVDYQKYSLNWANVDYAAFGIASGAMIDDIEMTGKKVPEPGSLALAAIGLLAASIVLRKRT